MSGGLVGTPEWASAELSRFRQIALRNHGIVRSQSTRRGHAVPAVVPALTSSRLFASESGRRVLRSPSCLAEPVCARISHWSGRTQVSPKSVKRDWLSILVVVVQIVVILAAAAMVYAAVHSY